MNARSKTHLAAGNAARVARPPLRLVLVVPFLLQIFLAVGLTGWLSFRHGRQAVDQVASSLRAELTSRVREYLRGYLETPHLINELNAGAIAHGQLDWRDPQALGRHFRYQLDRFDSAAFIFFGSSEGGAAGAGRRSDGTVVVDHTDLDPERGMISGTRYEYLAGPDGERRQRLKADPGFDARQRPWFAAAETAGAAVWSDVYPLFAEEALAVAASRPVYGGSGELLGVLGVDLRLAGIDAFLRDLEIGKTGQSFILERSGLLIASSTAEGPLIAGDSGRGPERLPAAASAEPLIGGATWFLKRRFGDLAAIDSGHQLAFDIDGERQLMQLAPLDDSRGLDWLLVIVVPEADYMAPIAASRRRTIQLCLVAFVVATVLGLYTSRWIARPIRRLSAASRAIAGGRLDQTVEVAGAEELDDLARSFNLMAAQLRDSFGELEARVEERTVELRQAKDAADAANQAKTRFLANVSHEIRTPLAAMLGFVELLRDSRLSAEEREAYLRTMRGSGGHLNQLLSDLLDVGRIEAGRLELDVRPCELAKLLAYLSSAFEPLARERGLELEIVTDARLPWRFSTDATRLRQILSNLLSNAVKFTAAGHVRLTVEVESGAAEESGAGALLVFRVEDTGAGIREQDRRRLFERFTQLDTPGARGAGFGLGLSITRQLTELMGGEVSVASREGEGSTFTVRLPVTGCDAWARSRQGYRGLAGAAELSGLPRLDGRVLVADDSEALRLLCARMLERWGLEVATAADGRQAVELGRQGFDAILMDWQMPELDGLEATTRLRRAGIATPIVALTAATMDGDRERCLAAGCDAYLVKPIDFLDLYRLLASILASSSPLPAEGADEDEELAALTRGFVSGLPDKVAGLRAALESGDWQRLDAGVHRLAGTAGSYGLGRVFRAAEALEQAAGERDPAAAGARLERLAALVESGAE